MSIIYMYHRRYRMRRVLAAIVLLFMYTFIYMSPLYADGFSYKSAVAQPSVKFFAGSQDIPVMPGLIELEGRSFSYDKPEGEITQIVAQMDGVNSEQVLFYYDAILPQFGWGKVSKVFDGANFFREDEYLDISFDVDGAQSLVKIMVRPSR